MLSYCLSGIKAAELTHVLCRLVTDPTLPPVDTRVTSQDFGHFVPKPLSFARECLLAVYRWSYTSARRCECCFPSATSSLTWKMEKSELKDVFT